MNVEKKGNKGMGDFLKEMRDVVSDEREKGTAHFLRPDFSLEKLGEPDIIIWEKIKDETITPEDFKTYQSLFFSESGKLRDGITPSQYDFMQFLANKAMAIFAKRAVKALANKQKK